MPRALDARGRFAMLHIPVTTPEDGREAARAPRLSLLEAFRLVDDGRELALTTPAQRLLAYLALRRRPVLRDHAAEELWMDSSQDHALGSLRSALWRLRQPRCELVRVSGCRLELAPRLVVDVHEAVLWARRMLAPEARQPAMDVGGLVYFGEILPDWYDDWVMVERERFRLLRVQAARGALRTAHRRRPAHRGARGCPHGDPGRATAREQPPGADARASRPGQSRRGGRRLPALPRPPRPGARPCAVRPDARAARAGARRLTLQ